MNKKMKLELEKSFFEIAKKRSMNSHNEFIKKYGKKVYWKLHKKAKEYFEDLYQCSWKGFVFHNIGKKLEDYFRMNFYIPLLPEHHASIHFKHKKNFILKDKWKCNFENKTEEEMIKKIIRNLFEYGDSIKELAEKWNKSEKSICEILSLEK